MRLPVECPLEMIAAHADLLCNLEQGNLAVKVFSQIYPGFPNSMVLSANTGKWRDIAVSQQRVNHEEIDGRFSIRVREPIRSRIHETAYGVLKDGISDPPRFPPEPLPPSRYNQSRRALLSFVQ